MADKDVAGKWGFSHAQHRRDRMQLAKLGNQRSRRSQRESCCSHFFSGLVWWSAPSCLLIGQPLLAPIDINIESKSPLSRLVSVSCKVIITVDGTERYVVNFSHGSATAEMAITMDVAPVYFHCSKVSTGVSPVVPASTRQQ